MLLETAPLLQNVSSPDESQTQPQEQNFTQRLSSAVHEPLSPLTKILLVLLLVLLLLSSVFIGLFAGAQHKLSKGRDGGGEEKPPSTATHTESYTLTESVTVTTSQTSTSIGISTSIAISTTTATTTTTVVVPAPVPTTAPEEVREVSCFI